MKTRVLKGSADHLVTAQPGKPVKFARRPAAIERLNSILVPYDFSAASSHALAYAIAFARQFEAKIWLLSVVPDVPTTFERGDPEYERSLDLARRACQAHLEEVLKEQVPADLSVRAMIRSGRPFECILKTAREQRNDLIIMATHREPVEEQDYLGSTTERVVRHANCPVLVVRFPEQDFVDVTRCTRLHAKSRDAEAGRDLGRYKAIRKEQV